MKTDARVRYTKMIIRQCFFRLLRQKSISKITVKEICELAQINRSTFYKYYADPYDLLEKLEEEAILGITQMIDEYPQKGLRPVLVTILRAICSNSDFHDLAFLQTQEDFTRRLALACFHKIQMYNPAFSSNGGMLFGCLCGAVSGLLAYWLHSGLKETPEEIADRIILLTEAVQESFTKENIHTM